MNAVSPEIEQQQMPPQAVIMQTAMGFIVSQAVSVAARLCIADYLQDGAKTVSELVALTGTHAPSLYRLLRALTSVNIFQKDANGHFANTPVSDFLRSDHPESLRGMVHLIGDREHWNAHGNMLHTVKTGGIAFEHAFGMPVFAYYAQNPEPARIFDEAMTSFSTSIARAVAAAYDFTKTKTIADIGGGHGYLLETVLQSAPDARGILFDQPQVVADAKVSERVEIVGGDFFSAIPVKADIYLMKFILHDWNDEESVTILQNIAKSAESGAKVLLVEMIVEEDDNAPSMSKLMDLNMLSMTSGRERTANEYAGLFEKSGFKLLNILPTASATQIIEAVKI